MVSCEVAMNSTRMIRKVLVVAILTLSRACGVTIDTQNDDPPESTEIATQSETQVIVPEDLQLITPLVACNKSNEACVVPQLCSGSGGHPVTGKCPAGKQCCLIPAS